MVDPVARATAARVRCCENAGGGAACATGDIGSNPKWMGDVINLRQARKARDRRAAEQAANEARARHGRTKAERALEKAEAERATRNIEQSRRERPDAPGD